MRLGRWQTWWRRSPRTRSEPPRLACGVGHTGFVFTLDEARRRFAGLRPRIDEAILVRADLAELRADLNAGGPSPLGGLAEAKALEARLYAVLEEIAEADVQVKGYAPMLLDFPGERDGRTVLWCWLEGDADVEWYHRVECGFPGRRRV
jgi:hypothetical protein